MSCIQCSLQNCPSPECKLIHTAKRHYCRRVKTCSKSRGTRKQLKTICPSSGDCISFGRHVNEINDYFDFTTFAHVTNLELLGTSSANGFIHKLTYKKNNYSAYAILKASQRPSADNILYEYLVGMYINKVMLRFPCFIQTYGLFSYQQLIPNVSAKEQLQSLRPETFDFHKSCTAPTELSILIQHVPAKYSLYAIVKKLNYISAFGLNHILFILYHTLSSLSASFTHYDLHSENVILYIPDITKCIQYVYHFEDGSQISFKNACVPKIIDYGRCYFNTGQYSSNDVYHEVCKQCDSCGKYHGYKSLNELDRVFCSRYKNESIDLRLLYHLHKKIKKIMPAVPSASLQHLSKLLPKVNFGKGVLSGADASFGTAEVINPNPNGSIYNVTDAYREFKQIILHPDIQQENDKMYGEPLGILHVYPDRMEYKNK